MPRKKKTLEQKRNADERKSTLLTQEIPHAHVHNVPLYSFSTQGHTVQSMQHTQTVKPNTITLVKKDILTTALISLSILTAQLLIYFLLKNHVLAIGFVRY